jgi:hypothetical protein
MTMRLPHGRLRRVLVQRMAVGIVAAFNRRDFDLIPSVMDGAAAIHPAQ